MNRATEAGAQTAPSEEMVGGTLRVVLRAGDNDEVSRVERALAGLLPTREEAWAAQRQAYQPKEE